MSDVAMAADFVEVTRFGAQLEVASAKVESEVIEVVRRDGLELLRLVKLKATGGRPGPERITGNYGRSWSIVFMDGGRAVSVGTNAPQGPRLEFGFIGADSLGRFYSQPPYPHLRPAVDEIAPRFERDIAETGARLLPGV